jgi:hypothetical protein
MAAQKKKSQAQKAVTKNNGILSFFKKRMAPTEPEQLQMDMNPGTGLPIKTM